MDSSDINAKLSSAFHEAMHYFADRDRWQAESFKDNIELYSIPSHKEIKVVIAQLMLTKPPAEILEYVNDPDTRESWDKLFGTCRLLRNEGDVKVLYVKNKSMGISRRRDFVFATKQMMVGDTHVSIATSVNVPEAPKVSLLTVRGQMVFYMWMAKLLEDGRTCLTCTYLIDPHSLLCSLSVNKLNLKCMTMLKILKQNLESN